MKSLKDFLKNTLEHNQAGRDYSQANRQFWYRFYVDFFINLLTNYFEWDNLPASIDELWLEKALCFNGFVGFFEHKDCGLMASKGAMGNRLDIYDNPTVFNPVSNSFEITMPRSVPINWYGDTLYKNHAVIIGNNNFYRPALAWIEGFAIKLADIEQTIQLNRNAQMRPYVILTEEPEVFSMKNFMNKVLNGDPVIYVKKKKTSSNSVDPLQLPDMVSVLDTKTEYLLDKLHDEKQRVINQMLTLIGINNNAVDKAERLVSAEATSNNGLINACIEVSLSARQKGIDRVNKCWGTNITVRPSSQIAPFNTEKVMEDIDNQITTLNGVNRDQYGLSGGIDSGNI